MTNNCYHLRRSHNPINPGSDDGRSYNANWQVVIHIALRWSAYIQRTLFYRHVAPLEQRKAFSRQTEFKKYSVNPLTASFDLTGHHNSANP